MQLGTLELTSLDSHLEISEYLPELVSALFAGIRKRESDTWEAQE